jgi:threonine synthase
MHEISSSNGCVEKVTEQEIADAKAWVGRAGIGCEPASAASLAGIRKLRQNNVIRAEDDVIGVLTGNVLKDPDYIYRYHTGALQAPDASPIAPNFANAPVVVPNDAEKIVSVLSE